jgi:hypothetical protein
MARLFNISKIGESNTMNRVFNIPWVGEGKIPWVGVLIYHGSFYP